MEIDLRVEDDDNGKVFSALVDIWRRKFNFERTLCKRDEIINWKYIIKSYKIVSILCCWPPPKTDASRTTFKIKIGMLEYIKRSCWSVLKAEKLLNLWIRHYARKCSLNSCKVWLFIAVHSTFLLPDRFVNLFGTR